MNQKIKKAVPLLILFSALAIRICYLALLKVPFNSDEAIVGLMAKHILLGERPIFFYGQVYMGSLDGILVSLGFLIFGEHVWVIRFVQTVLYLSVIYTTIIIGSRITGSEKIGWIAGLIISFPTVNMTLYTTASLGGYGEALLIGNLIVIVGLKIISWIDLSENKIRFPWFYLVLLGFLVGLGLWANGLTLVYSAPVGLAICYFLYKKKTQYSVGGIAAIFICIVIGLLIGATPWIYYGFSQANLDSLVQELFGQAVSVESGGLLSRISTHIVSLLLLGIPVLLGFRPPWTVEWLVLPLLPLILAFWIAVIYFSTKRFGSSKEYRETFLIPIGICCFLLCGFIFTSFGVDPSGRYFLPLMIPMAIFAGDFITQQLKAGWQKWVVIGLLLAFNIIGTFQAGFNNPTGLTTQFDQITAIDHEYDQDLIAFLKENGEYTGYTNYWVSYPLAFHSNEELIFIPRLPYHHDLRYTTRDDRYEPYTEKVENAEKWAYITTNHSLLNDVLRSGFDHLGVEWKEVIIGDFHVFYDLTQPVPINELGLGENYP
jgi:4-amino-4-deoxy-L-arabinose transferase-like glycosyltransferase